MKSSEAAQTRLWIVSPPTAASTDFTLAFQKARLGTRGRSRDHKAHAASEEQMN